MHRLFVFILAAGEHCHFQAHLGGKLDGQMPETADADHADTIPRFEAGFMQRTPDRSSAAHQRASMFGSDLIRNLVQGRDVPHDSATEATLVVVCGAELHTVETVDVVT